MFKTLSVINYTKFHSLIMLKLKLMPYAVQIDIFVSAIHVWGNSDVEKTIFIIFPLPFEFLRRLLGIFGPFLTKSLKYALVCLAACREPLNGYSRNFVLGNYINFRRHIPKFRWNWTKITDTLLWELDAFYTHVECPSQNTLWIRGCLDQKLLKQIMCILCRLYLSRKSWRFSR